MPVYFIFMIISGFEGKDWEISSGSVAGLGVRQDLSFKSLGVAQQARAPLRDRVRRGVCIMAYDVIFGLLGHQMALINEPLNLSAVPLAGHDSAQNGVGRDFVRLRWFRAWEIGFSSKTSP